MPALGRNLVYATGFVCILRGSSQAVLVRASDGLLYVVKFTNIQQSPNVPFNEAIGTELFRACGLAVPLWKQLWVTDSFLDKNKECWSQTEEGPKRPVPGMCFGSCFLGGNRAYLLEILSGSDFKRVKNRSSFWLAWLIDICATHVDHRQAVFVDDGSRILDARFIDHGELFGGPKGDQKKNFRASRYLDDRIYQDLCSSEVCNLQADSESVNQEKLWQRAMELPDEWKTVSAFDGLKQCLGRMSTHCLVEEIIETMREDIHQANAAHARKLEPGWSPPEAILRPQIQEARR
jgi:hypothetical protein